MAPTRSDAAPLVGATNEYKDPRRLHLLEPPRRASQRQPAGSRPRAVRDAITARRGTEGNNIAKVAAARELLTLVFYGLRDGRVRCLAGASRPASQAPAQAA